MAVNRLYDMSMSVRDIAIAVGRGGTSGTGVASFESGGFILDSGHKFSEKGSLSYWQHLMSYRKGSSTRYVQPELPESRYSILSRDGGVPETG
ncbi:hypothetical protein DRO03_04925 [Methanosarcinales archaeon]|nr:MAG: hypothetical protein DRO03_04925 [Methanosarcinales archaeon]